MDGVVERLHCRYHLLGDPAASAPALPPLGTAAAEGLAAGLGRALDLALAGDPSVYVLRRVRSAVALAVDPDTGDDALVAAWSERLAGSVVRSLAAAEPDNLVRFEDQADYVAAFVVDLLGHRAWDRWYYLAFDELRARPRAEALLAVLLDHRESLPEILARLARRGALDELLAALPTAALSELWLRGLGGRPLAPEIGLRPVVAAALGLLRSAGLLRADRDRAEGLLRELGAGRAAAVEWRDPTDLALAVAGALAVLVDQGVVGRDRLREAAGALREEVARLDWLDRETLAAAVDRLAASSPVRHPAPTRHGATPRQRRLLGDLARAIAASEPGVARDRPDSPAAALGLAAALYAGFETWRGDPLVPGLVRELLETWATIRATPAPSPVLGLLRRGDTAGAVAVLRGQLPDGRAAAAERFLALGAPAVEALAALAAVRPRLFRAAAPAPAGRAARVGGLPGFDPGGVVVSPVAGVFLLLRAARDLRLEALLERAGYPSSGVLGRSPAGLLALARRWAGRDGPPGRDLALLAGLSTSPSAAEHAACFPADDPGGAIRLQRELAAAAVAHRLDRGPVLRLFDHRRYDARAIVVQLGETDLWPLGRLVGPGDDPARAVADLLAEVGRLRGAPETASADASLAPALPAPAGWPAWDLAGPDQREVPHTLARGRLQAALGDLEHGRLHPGVASPADLTLGLAATVVLRAWVRWLRGLDGSSVPFILRELVRRPGRLLEAEAGVRVELDPAPLDLVLEMAGYLGELAGPGGRTVTFALGAGRCG